MRWEQGVFWCNYDIKYVVEQTCGGEQSVYIIDGVRLVTLSTNGFVMLYNKRFQQDLLVRFCVDEKVTVLCDQGIFRSEKMEDVLRCKTCKYPSL